MTYTIENFITLVNNTRKANKDKWYFITEVVDGKQVQIKGYNNWLQIFRVDNIAQNTTMDNSVKGFLAELANGLK